MTTQTAPASITAQSFVAFEAAFLHVVKGFGSASIEVIGGDSENVTVQISHPGITGYNVRRSIQVALMHIAGNVKLDDRLRSMEVLDATYDRNDSEVKLYF